jgi:hypothetical protein
VAESEVVTCFVCRGKGQIPYWDDRKGMCSTECVLCKGNGKLRPKVFMEAIDWEAVDTGGNRE